MTRPAPTFEDLEEAADWLDEAADGWAAGRRTGFLEWLAGHPARLEAVRRVSQAMGDPMLDAALRDAMEQPVAAPVRPVEAPVSGKAPPAFPRFAMAAALGLAVLGAGGWIWQQQANSLHLETPAGPGLVQKLADGSTVHLDGRSDLTVRLHAHSRELALTSGRGLFEVAHAPDRPFTVSSHGVAVTAVGTVFEVAQIGSATMVRVRQGRVRVVDDGVVSYLGAGNGLMLTADHHATALTFPADPSGAAGDWIDAHGDRLDSILARLAHASPHKIDCAPGLAARPVSGRYRLSDPEGSLRLIALANGWRVETVEGGWRLSPA